MPIPPPGLLVRAHLFNQLTAKVELAHRYYTAARWNDALNGISNREKRIACRFQQKRLGTAALAQKVERLARMQLVVDDSLRPGNVDRSSAITTDRLQSVVHLKLLSIRCQMTWQRDDQPRREIDRMIQDCRPDDRPMPRDMPGRIAEIISPDVHQYEELPSATSRFMVGYASTDLFNIPDWYDISKDFWTTDAIRGFESFSEIVSAGVEKILCKAPSKCSTAAEKRCRLTFEVLEFIHRQEPANLSDEWSPNKFLFDTYRSILEGEVVEQLLAERPQPRTDSEKWNDSAVGSSGSSSAHSDVRDSNMACGHHNYDDSDNWSDGEEDFDQYTHLPDAHSTPGAGRYS